MKEWIGTTEVRIDVPTVVSIGKFDGEHKGHQKIFSSGVISHVYLVHPDRDSESKRRTLTIT